MDVIPIVPLAGLALAGVVAFRSRNVFRPRITLETNWPFRARTEMSWRQRRAVPRAHFAVGEDIAPELVRLPIYVTNRSRRKIGDVSLVLQFPRAFAVGELAAKEMVDRTIAAIPAFADDMAGTYRFLSQRTVDLDPDCATVTYKIGALQPGGRILIPEMLVFKDRARNFQDSRYKHSAFSDVLERLARCDCIRGLCQVTITLLSDLLPPIYRTIDVVSARDVMEGGLREAVGCYRDSYWLGAPPPGLHYGPRIPFSRRYGRRLSRWEAADFVMSNDSRVIAPAPVGQVAVSFKNERDSVMGRTSVYMPGFDPRVLPRGTDTAAAVQWLGYRRVG